MISSTLMTGKYERHITDHELHVERQANALVADQMENNPASPAAPIA